MNPSGFFFYATYSVAGRVNPTLGTGEITNQDLVFALHAFALSSVQLSQIFIYDRGTQGAINLFWIIFLICCYIAVFTDWGIEVFHGALPNDADTFLMMGYCKAAITFLKYCPQVYLNWKRKSCVGWSFANICLDFGGGSLSLLQSAVKSIFLGDPFFDPGAFNLVKFILAICSIFFDSIFFFQFWLYSGNKPSKTIENFDDSGDQKGMLDNKLNGTPMDTDASPDTSGY